MFGKSIVCVFLALALAGSCSAIKAHNGEIHEAEPHKEIANSAVKLQKQGDPFEIVAVLSADTYPNTTIYLSDTESNRPIGNAAITLKVNAANILAEKTDKEGIYQANLPLDSLTALEVNIEKEALKEQFMFDNIALATNIGFWGSWSFKFGAFLLILVILGLVTRYQLISYLKRLFVISLLMGVGVPYSFGHGDEESVPREIEATENSLVVSKELQFELGIITEKVTEKPLQGSVRLMGTVISDPSGYARIQSTQTVRIINHPDYPLPLPGQAVKKDQVILAVTPTLTTVESTDQKNFLYKAESEISQLQKEVGRLEKLGQFSARKDLENVQAELERALKQKDEILNRTFKPELLRSPIDGLVADFHVRPGEIVTSDKIIVEIVDPTKLLIEALVFDPNLANQIVGGYTFSPLSSDKVTPVKVLGVSPKVNKEDQSIHIQLKPEKIAVDIKLDMAVEVIGELKEQVPTLVIPLKAVVEDNQGAWIFIHATPETFEPRKIRLKRRLNDLVEVETGVEVGEKIVIEGAYLLAQAK